MESIYAIVFSFLCFLFHIFIDSFSIPFILSHMNSCFMILTLSLSFSLLSLPLPVLLSPSLPLFHFALFYISIICSLTVDDLRGYTFLDRRMKGCHNIQQNTKKERKRERENVDWERKRISILTDE